MLNSPSLEDSNDFRRARTEVMTSGRVHATTAARLEARGVDVGELERRLLQNMAFRA